MAELAKQVKLAGEDSLSVQVTGRELPALDEHLRHMSVVHNYTHSEAEHCNHLEKSQKLPHIKLRLSVRLS